MSSIICQCGDHVEIDADCMCMELSDLRGENVSLRRSLVAVQRAARLMAVTWAIGVYEPEWLEKIVNDDRYSFVRAA